MTQSLTMLLEDDDKAVHKIRLRAPEGAVIDDSAIDCLGYWMKEKLDPERYSLLTANASSTAASS